MYFNVNFNVFFKLIKVHLLVSKFYIYQNAQRNDKKINKMTLFNSLQLSRQYTQKHNSRDYVCDYKATFHFSDYLTDYVHGSQPFLGG